jgi:branched-chain amino acid transport system permease protein
MTTKVPNFAFADFAVVGMNASYFSFILFKLSSPYLTAPFSVLAGGGFAVLVYLLVMKPLIRKGSSILLLMIATLAVDIVFTGVQADIVTIGLAPFSASFIHAGFPSLVQAAPLPDFNIHGQSGLLIASPVMLAVSTALMYLLLKRSRFGIAMRAAIENPSLARIVGIDVERVYLVSWFIAGSLGGLAGCLYAIGDGMTLGLQSTLILDIFAGSVLGGLSSVYGAVIGGVLVSVGENYVLGVLSTAVSSQISLLAIGGVSMIILIVTLLIAPKGLAAVNWKKVFSRRG